MIGVQPDTERTVYRRPLAPGSLLLLYTDGLVERRGQDLQDGIARLARALAQNPHGPLGGIADNVLSLPTGPLEDDAAVLAPRLPPSSTTSTGQP